ncbi:DUF1093 domain-containing protein [Gracilibacillus phocaeensis]|uniref:DUF1093 domain-containing protein n=1 Tax=Gracilibacillus phocaeensis TaxID=2042304 RepID=UPI0010310523|nr:YxeA family protein [Gracilibacillus phocaeensis]
MKKIAITCVGLLAFLAILFVGIQQTTAGIIPLSDWMLHNNEESLYYVETTTDYEELWNGNYRYEFTGFDQEGNKQRIVRVMDRELQPNAYLEIYTAGRFGKGWVEVPQEAVPEGALMQLNR